MLDKLKPIPMLDKLKPLLDRMKWFNFINCKW